MKKRIAMLLALVMAASLCIVPASAARGRVPGSKHQPPRVIPTPIQDAAPARAPAAQPDSATLKGIDIITNPALELAVPTAAPNATATNERSLAVTGVYDDGSGGPVAVNWEITTTPIPKGVSLDGSTLKVTNEAEAGKVRIEASYTEEYTDAEYVTITKEPPAASAIVATAPTTTSITIPNVGTTTSGNCSYKVYDQYGAEMTGISAT